MILSDDIINDMDESTLVASAAAGDPASFSRLVSRYGSVVSYVVNTMCGDRGEREDLMQEGLIGLLKAVRTYDGTVASFATYASLCIRRSVITAMRRYRRSSLGSSLSDTDDGVSERSVAFSPSAEDVVLDKESTDVLYARVMALLSDYERAVFERYLDGEKTGKIAALVGRDAKSVGNAVFRIKRKIAAALGL